MLNQNITLIAMILITAHLTGCRTGTDDLYDDSSLADVQAGATPAPESSPSSTPNVSGDLLLELGAESAHVMYDALQATAVSTTASGSITEKKELNGELKINGGSFNDGNGVLTLCKILKVEPASGFGAPTVVQVLTLKDDAAKEFLTELAAPENTNGSKSWEGPAQISCSHFTDQNSYYCEIRDLTPAPAGSQDGDDGLPPAI